MSSRSHVSPGRVIGVAAIALAAPGLLGGCVYKKETVPAASPTTVVVTPPARTATYAGGRYELRGNGTTVPYYWVWIPAGANPPAPPPPPSVP